MKKIKYNLLLFVVITSLFSCDYNDPINHPPKKTQAAKVVFDQMEKTLLSYLDILNLAQKIDTYMIASPEEREDIQFNLLDGLSILEKENNVIELKFYRAVKWSIARNSANSLSTPGTEWKILGSDGSGLPLDIPENGFTITAQQTANVWILEVDNCLSAYSPSLNSASLEVKMESTHDLEPNYIANSYSITTIEGKTCEINSTIDKLNAYYEIVTPLLFSNSERVYNSFTAGEIEIKVERGTSDKIDDITAEIYANGSLLLLTFRGVSETWDH